MRRPTLTLVLATALAACGGGGSTPARTDAATTSEAGLDGGLDAGLGDAATAVDTGGPVDLGTGADGFSTWQPGAPYPALSQLVTTFHASLTLSYVNASTPVEEVMNARADGVAYYFNFADALGRYVYLSREGCAFDDVHVFKVATAGESSGPVAVSAQSVADVEISLSNPSDVRLAALTEADLPAGATGACRALDDTSFEYEGLGLVRHLTVGVRVSRTAARCDRACGARGDASEGCRTTCLAAPLPFTGEVTFDLGPDLALSATRPAGGALTYAPSDGLLDGRATLVLQ
ncbi:MAG: hypothetical protein JWM10_489 [Myxococcaceae bacterium]|nr:hypothetical protein [Myxococcaceae bacterium]